MIALVWAAAGHCEVYRCTTNGTVTYSDMPCTGSGSTGSTQPSRIGAEVPLSNPVAVPTKPAPPNFYGGWSGQAQYQATIKSRPVDEAHAVVDLVFTIDPKGKLTGV